ncbi:UDP-3-O-(3-hydroxymyristoyl)glucosamine N-acyltransferase [Prochlorococcus marinus]|uniref:UDP-3-O-acylglucosamine N-acyltransferase n=1 Tax=Prochlorococcus marinus (strain MIT 9211) TaxID=93059 RepID=A9BAP3_PROM4|nr:UDP-3-O-(3-hydroxymyristoyl)glucosamine N-acyltransferase [Prochlorococcus marinus]ABX08905.1 UDP-3-O-[3-hydroxymyristoyl] glucosamine N-acyltransferase [Prochlorococcus marinus str. MIT 9211]
MQFSQLIDFLKIGEAHIQDFNFGDDPEITKASSIDIANPDEISFLENDSYLLSHMSSTNASALLLPNNNQLIDIANSRGIAWASFRDPKLAFAETLEYLHPQSQPLIGIHKTAVIGKNVKIGKEVSIGANVTVGDYCQIGEGTVISPGVVIYNNVQIGIRGELHANAVIHENTNIGNNCTVQSNAVIGSEGFGFIPSKNGWRKMPQIGIVVIEDNVEVGAGSTIDRPSVGETRIGSGTKIDNLVQIGHGVVTGRNCAMAAQVGIAGGASLGDGVILAGQVGVGNRVSIGDGVIASSKCGVHADVSPGEVISGFPAMPNKLWLRCSANFKKLPEIAKSIRDLTKSHRG